MKTLLFIFAVAAIASASCGDNLGRLDGGVKKDSTASPDAFCSNCPAAPTLGPQIDRLGRPAVNTVLNHGFDGTANAGPAKDTYNQDSARGQWPTLYTATFMTALGMVDVLDTGLSCTDGACTPKGATSTPGDGCGNQPLYNGGAGGAATATSYGALAMTLADDELYLDTTKTTCDLPSHQNYLAVEIDVVTGDLVQNSTCGGRAPTNDVIDTSYTALAIGLGGFKASDGSFTPAAKDGVGPHADVSNDTFPFLGPPH